MRSVFLVAFLGCVRAFAAISGAAVWEIRTAGDNNNGCFFVEGASGTDRSQQDTAHASTTASTVVNATTTIIDVAVSDYTVTAADVGNAFHITGGTATAGWYQITAVDTANNRWTLDRSAGSAGATAIGAMGGACGALNSTLMNIFTTGNRVWIRSGTYSVSSGITNLNAVDGVLISGYGTTRGDTGRATLRATAGSLTILTVSNASAEGAMVRNLILDCNGNTSTSAFAGTGGYKRLYYVLAKNCSSAAITLNGAQCFYCGVEGQTSGVSFSVQGNHAVLVDSYVKDPGPSTSHAFQSGGTAQMVCIRCIAEGHASATNADAFNINTGQAFISDSLCYNAGRDCYRYACSANCQNVTVINSICYTAGGYCHNLSTGGVPRNFIWIDYTANGGAASGNFNSNLGSNPGPAIGPNNFSLTANPFTNAAINDFTPNNAAGGGAVLRDAGFQLPMPLP